MKIKIIDVIRIRALIADVTASFKSEMGQKQEKEDESSYRAIVATPNFCNAASISVDWVNSTKYNLGAVFIDIQSECGNCKIILNKGSASLDFNDKTYVLYKGQDLAELKSLVIATLKEITKIADIVESIIY